MTSFATLSACERCAGAGIIPQFSHVQRGVCFDCRGTGVQDFVSQDIRRNGWAAAASWTQLRFVQSGIALLSAPREEGAPTATGWRDAVMAHLYPVLPLLNPTYFDLAIAVIEEAHHIDRTWVEQKRPHRADRSAA